MKKTFQIILFVLSVLALTGCTTVEDHVIVNEDGVNREIVININELAETYNKKSAEIAIKEINEKAKEAGYEVLTEDLVSEGKMILKLRKQIESVDPNNFTIEYSNEEKNKEFFTISKLENFFTTEYSANSKFDISFLEDLNNVQYRLYLHFPNSVEGKSTTNVKANSDVLVWQTGEEKTLDVKFNVESKNLGNIYMVVGPFILVLLVVGFYLYRKKNLENMVDRRRVPVRNQK